MFVSKKFLVCSVFFLSSSNCILGAHEVFTTSVVRRSLGVSLVRATTFYNYMPRWYSDRNKNNPGSIESFDLSPVQKALRAARYKVDHYESLLIQNKAALEGLKNALDEVCAIGQFDKSSKQNYNPVAQTYITGKNVQPVFNTEVVLKGRLQKGADAGRENSKRALAVITPVNPQNSLVSPLHLQYQNSSLESEQPNLETLNYSESKDCRGKAAAGTVVQISRIQEGVLQYQNLSRTVDEMRSDFVNRVMSAATHKTKPQDVQDIKDILDLYTSLVEWKREGITKVLMGQTDNSKSIIYGAVVNHAKTRQKDLEMFREMYRRVCNTMGKDPMQVVYKVIEELIREKKDRLSALREGDGEDKMSREEYISLIVIGSHPLYPVQPKEVESILDLYTSLKKWKREGITKVLKGQTDNSKSSIYNAVVDHVTPKHSDLKLLYLKTYRNIYRRLMQSLSGEAIEIIYSMIDNEKHTDVGQGLVTRPSQFLTPQLDQSISEAPTSQNSFVSHDFGAGRAIDEQSMDRPPQNLYIANYSDSFLKTEGGQYKLSKKEQDRLGQVYARLSKYHAKSVTGVLSGKTINKSLPIWKDIGDVIDQIRQEVAQAGGNATQINLKYFRKLYWAAVRTATGYSSSIHGSFCVEKEGASGTKTLVQENDRLVRIYELLPEYHYKSVTGVLSRATKNENLPIWKDMEEAIEQIRQELAQEDGNTTHINLGYFQELYSKFSKAVGTERSNAKVTSKDKEVFKEKKSPKKQKSK